jgi:hypothetical protein
VGRLPFIEGLEQRMLDADKVKLLENRRTGKSSVGQAVIARFRAADRPGGRVDLSPQPDPARAARELAEQMAPSLAVIGKAKQATGWLAALWTRLSSGSEEVLIGEVVAGLVGESPLIGSVLARCSEAIAGQNAAILIDEAHLIADWPLHEQASLREFLRSDTRIGVIVSSSLASALERLTDDDGPLRYVGQRLPIPPIDRGDWEAALPARFAAVGTPIDAEALGLLLDESRGHPYCTMLLCRASARAALPGGRTDVAAVTAGLLEVRHDEGWALRDA